jgi:hypothetical protein
MNDKHIITPPPELVVKWIKSARYREFMPYPEGYEQYEQRLTTLAARWGADQELEACCEWLVNALHDREMGAELRADRRPKPPTDKELALHELGDAYDKGKIDDTTYDTIKRALEALPQ